MAQQRGSLGKQTVISTNFLLEKSTISGFEASSAYTVEGMNISDRAGNTSYLQKGLAIKDMENAVAGLGLNKHLQQRMEINAHKSLNAVGQEISIVKDDTKMAEFPVIASKGNLINSSSRQPLVSQTQQ